MNGQVKVHFVHLGIFLLAMNDSPVSGLTWCFPPFRSVSRNMPIGPFFDEFFKFAEKYRPLELNDDTVAFLTAVMIMCPGKSLCIDNYLSYSFLSFRQELAQSLSYETFSECASSFSFLVKIDIFLLGKHMS